MRPCAQTSLVWFRRDLRLDDHVALERAARASDRIVCAFVLDPPLLRGPDVSDAIVAFFFDALAELRAALRSKGSDLALLEGDCTDQLLALAKRVDAGALYYNVDYEPRAVERDGRVAAAARAAGMRVETFTDHVYYGAGDVLKADGTPYTVFTPYKRRWLEQRENDPRPPVDSLTAVHCKLAARDAIGITRDVPEPAAYGHVRPPDVPRAGENQAQDLLDAFLGERIADYAKARDFPAAAGTSHLSPHLRAGTLGIRTCIARAYETRSARSAARNGSETWVGELIWRDFYQQILAHFPRVTSEPFDERAQRIRYRDLQRDWDAWSQGLTGYPIVDAAMRQINTYGWMHNRLRMIVASFLTKDLLLDYHLGERYFAQHLVDGDKAANNGGWQWSASTGTDAAPYFRVFNPVLQSKKFDPNGTFIRNMLPELASLESDALHAPWTLAPLEAQARGFRLGRDYPEPIVAHDEARRRALAAYTSVFGSHVKS